MYSTFILFCSVIPPLLLLPPFLFCCDGLSQWWVLSHRGLCKVKLQHSHSIRQLAKWAFRSYCSFSQSWEVICVLCKYDQEKKSWRIFIFHLTSFITVFRSSPASSIALFLLLRPSYSVRPFSLPLFPFIAPSISLIHIFPISCNTSPPRHRSLFLYPSQVTPVRPLIRILSLSKCIVTGGWQSCVCMCVSTYVSVWQFGQLVGGDDGSRLAFLTWQGAALATDLTVI